MVGREICQMDEKVVYWVCGLGILIAALVPLTWVLVQKYKDSKQSTQTQGQISVVPVFAPTLEPEPIRRQRWEEMRAWLHFSIVRSNLELVPVPEKYCHELWLRDVDGAELLGIISFPWVNGEVATRVDLSGSQERFKPFYLPLEKRALEGALRRYIMQPRFGCIGMENAHKLGQKAMVSADLWVSPEFAGEFERAER